MTNWGHWKYQVMVLGAWCDLDNEGERNRCYVLYKYACVMYLGTFGIFEPSGWHSSGLPERRGGSPTLLSRLCSAHVCIIFIS